MCIYIYVLYIIYIYKLYSIYMYIHYAKPCCEAKMCLDCSQSKRRLERSGSRRFLGLPALHWDFGCPNLRSTSNHGRMVHRSLHMHNHFESQSGISCIYYPPADPENRLESRLQRPYVAGSSGYIHLEINTSIEAPVIGLVEGKIDRTAPYFMAKKHSFL